MFSTCSHASLNAESEGLLLLFTGLYMTFPKAYNRLKIPSTYLLELQRNYIPRFSLSLPGLGTKPPSLGSIKIRTSEKVRLECMELLNQDLQGYLVGGRPHLRGRHPIHLAPKAPDRCRRVLLLSQGTVSHPTPSIAAGSDVTARHRDRGVSILSGEIGFYPQPHIGQGTRSP